MTSQAPLFQRRRSLTSLFACIVFLIAGLASGAPKTFDVPAGAAEKSLKQFSTQAGVELVFATKLVAGVKTPALKGEFEPMDALARLLAGTLLIAKSDERTGAIVVSKEAPSDPNAPRLAQKNSDQPSRRKEKTEVTETGAIKLDTFEVMGSKLLNMDIKRSPDDVQPYVVFGRESIENANAVNLEDFLKQKLTMNTVAYTNSLSSGVFGAMSQVDLHGLGFNQTLILIDGHRPPSSNFQGGNQQSDLNGIPLAAIERVEILPTTASGIYGGNATGGVVNVILRRDYARAEVKVSYENSFDSDTAVRRVEISDGFNLEDGKTNVLIAASYSDANGLELRDRNYLQEGIGKIQQNNPTFFLGSTPPLGSTTNVRSRNGSPLFGPGTPNFTFVPVGYAGGGGLAPLLANAGSYNFKPSSTAQSTGGKSGLLNAPTVESVLGTVRRQFGPHVQGFLEIAAANNTGDFERSQFSGSFTLAATAPNNPFGQSINVRVPLNTLDTKTHVANFNRRAVVGVVVQLPGEWMGETDFTMGSTRYSYKIGATSLLAAGSTTITSGAVDVLRDLNAFPLDLSTYKNLDPYSSPFYSRMLDLAVRAAGPVFELPAGPIRLAALLERSDERFSDGFRYSSLTSTSYFPSRSQTIISGYAEVTVPLASPKNRVAGLESLEFQFAGRHDQYDVDSATGSVAFPITTTIVRSTSVRRSTNPTVGLKVQPIPSLVLRASYGTGFLPPAANQFVLAPNQVLPGSIFGFTDPKRGGEAVGTIAFITGGSPNLEPEKSKSWSAGLVFSPPAISHLRFSIDWTRIDKTNNITQLPFNQDFINNEALLPGRVIRGTPAPGDPYSVGPITALDFSLLNIAAAKVEAIDYALSYDLLTTKAGTFSFYAAATNQLHYITQLTPYAPTVENVGGQSPLGNGSIPLKFKLNGGLDWKSGRWTLGWAFRYFDSYYASTPTDTATLLNQGNGGRVASQTFHDVFAKYSVPQSMDRSFIAALLSGTEVQFGIKDVFNKAPAFDAGYPTSYMSPLGDPRRAVYYFSIKRAF